MKKMRLFYAVAMALFTLTFSSCDEDALQSLTGGGDDTVAALKEALTIGAQVASNKLGALRALGIWSLIQNSTEGRNSIWKTR